MDSWTIFSLAFAGVLFFAWLGRRQSPNWYLSGIVPLLYGGVIAWMFWEDAPLLALRIILFGALLPAALLGWLWWDARQEASDSAHPPQ